MTQKGVNRVNWSAEMVHIRCLATGSSRVYPSGLLGVAKALTDLECPIASNDLTCKMCRELRDPLTIYKRSLKSKLIPSQLPRRF